MYAALYLPSFRLQAALRLRADDLPQVPVVLVDGAEKKSLIMEINAAAQRAGVRPGQSVPRAMARCEDLLVVLRVPSAETAAHTALMQIASALSPEIESTAPGLCTLRLRLRRSRDAEKEGHRAVTLLEQAGLKAQAGLGPNPDLAFLAARRARPVLVVEEPSAFLDTLPVGVLRPPANIVELLHDWGIHTVRQLRSLPRADLIDRLGPEAGHLWEQATGQSCRLLHLVDPPREFVETFEFEHEVDTLEPLLFLLRRFLNHLSQRLRCMGRVAGSMTLTLTLERSEKYERFFSIPSPAADPEVLFRILFTHLESLRLEHRPAGMTLRLEPVLPGQDQFQLFETALRDPNKLGETLARLSALVGVENSGSCVRLNTHQPDAWRMEPPQFQKLPPAPFIPSLTGIPLRRCRPPLDAEVSMSGDTPEYVASAVGRGEVVAALGPHCSSGQWWERAPTPKGLPINSRGFARNERTPGEPPKITGDGAPGKPIACRVGGGPGGIARRLAPPPAIHGEPRCGSEPEMNSGNHANGWSREEWDVELKDGTLLRLAYTGGDWVVEGLYETPAAPPARAFPLHVVP